MEKLEKEFFQVEEDIPRTMKLSKMYLAQETICNLCKIIS